MAKDDVPTMTERADGTPNWEEAAKARGDYIETLHARRDDLEEALKLAMEALTYWPEGKAHRANAEAAAIIANALTPARSASSGGWKCSCGLLVAPQWGEPYMAKDGSVHSRQTCYGADERPPADEASPAPSRSRLKREAVQRGEPMPTFDEPADETSHQHDWSPWIANLDKPGWSWRACECRATEERDDSEPDNHERVDDVCPRCERHVCTICTCACDSYGYPPKYRHEPADGNSAGGGS